MKATIKKFIIFGDEIGIPQLLKCINKNSILAIVCAVIRPKHLKVIKKIAKTNNIQLLIQPKYKSDKYLEFVTSIALLQPEFFIVNSYSMKLHSDILKIPCIAAINIHGAILPNYRGCNPTQWALLNYEIETGVTMHYMTENFDHGDIIAQKKVPILIEDTWIDIHKRVAIANDELLKEEIPKILKGTNERKPQQDTLACYYPRRKPEDGLVDWSKPVMYNYNLIRGLVRPHPGAFFFIGERRVVIDKYLTIPQVTILKYNVTGGVMLRSKNIYLAPLTQDDSELMYKWINKREDVLFNAPYKPISESQHKEWFDNTTKRNDLIIFGIRIIKTDGMVGSCQLLNINYIHRKAELQIRLGEREQRGKGFATQAVELLLDFAFTDLNLNRIYLNVFAYNLKAIRSYEKVGFVKEGLKRMSVYIDGTYKDVIIMSILKKEFDENNVR